MSDTTSTTVANHKGRPEWKAAVEVKTLEQWWNPPTGNASRSADAALQTHLNDGWSVLNITVAVNSFVDTYGDFPTQVTEVYRIVTLTR